MVGDKMKNFKKLLIIFVVVLLTGCFNSKSLNGNYYRVINSNIEDTEYYKFNKDTSGTYVLDGKEQTFKYEDRGNKLVITFDSSLQTVEYDYSLENDLLTIKDSFGIDKKYKKN